MPGERSCKAKGNRSQIVSVAINCWEALTSDLQIIAPGSCKKEEIELVSGIPNQTHYDSVIPNQVYAIDPAAGTLLLKGPDGNVMSISALQFPS